MNQSTQLESRTLWFDGDSTVEPNFLADLILQGLKIKDGIHISEPTSETDQFNQISDYQLTVKDTVRPLSMEWDIPDKYLTLKLRTYVLELLVAEVERDDSLTPEDVNIRIQRVDDELELYYKSNLHHLLRTAIFVVDTFREKNVVWGVGRGSSCASYILYLIGVHDIDSIVYDLDVSDFLR